MTTDRSLRLASWAGGALAAIIGLAAALRVLGLAYGLPHVYNQDEVAILNRALRFATRDFNPHNFVYPTLYFYVLFVWECLYFVAARVAGTYHSLAEFQRSFFVDPSGLYLAGRSLTALLGTWTVYLTYRLGASLYDRTVGIVAALFLAVAPFAVIEAHYIKHDVPVTLLIVLVVLSAVRLTTMSGTASRSSAWAASGVLIGVSMAVHYYAVFACVPVIIAAGIHAQRSGSIRDGVRGLAIAALAATIAFCLTTPFLLIDWHTALRDMAQNRQIVVDRAVAGGGAFASVARYAEMLRGDALGWPVAALGVLGLVVALLSDWRKALVLLSFPCAFLIFISNTVPANRYLVPALPFIVVVSALALVSVARKIGRGAWAPILVIAAAGLAAWPAARASASADMFFRQTDTRTLALNYVEAQIPDGASILIQPYSVPLRPSRAGLVEALERNLGDAGRASVKFKLMLDAEAPGPAYRLIYLGEGGLDQEKIYVSAGAFTGGSRLAPLRDLRVQYVVLKRYDVPDPALQSLDAELRADAVRVAEFWPYRTGVSNVAPFLHNAAFRIDPGLERPGPGIEIWKIQELK